MKQSVYALLVASASAQAEPLKKILSRKEILNMEADKDIPLPQFRSDSIDDKCADTATQAADTAVTALKTAIDALNKQVPALKTAVDTALAAKKTAVAAVLSKDDSVATTIKADDDADFAVLTALRAKNLAQYAYDKANAAAATALAAKTAADTAVTTGTALKTDHDASYADAKIHKGLEDGLVVTAASAKTTAKSAWDTDLATTTLQKSAFDVSTAAVASAATAETAAKTAYDAAKAISDAYKTARVDVGVAALGLSSATNDIKSGGTEDTSSSKPYWTAVKAAEDYWTTGSGSTKFATWSTLGQATEAAWLALITGVTTEDVSKYTKSTGGDSGKECATGTKFTTDATLGGKTKTETECVTACSALKPWDLSSATAPTSETYCLGFQHNSAGSGTCTGYHSAAVTAGGGAQANTDCYIRKSVALAKDYYDKELLSATSVVSWTAWGAKANAGMTDYFALIKTEDEAYRPMKIQIDINAAESTKYTGTHLADTTTKANAYDKSINGVLTDGKKQLKATADNDLTLKTTNYNTAKAASDLKETAYNTAVTAHNTALAQQALQGKIEALAKTASEAANTSLTALKATLATATAASTAADTAKTTAKTTLDTATTTYNAKVAAITATQTAATPVLANLLTLRAAAATAWGKLDTANLAHANKKAEIVVQQGLLDAATAVQLAAVVKCKETKYDSYKRALADRIRTRQTQLSKIETLIDDSVAKKPAPGAAGARCEKPTSAGNSKVRGKVCADDTLCCGAATGKVGGAVMTIEVCQAKAATTYAYQPPRAPLDTAFPAAVAWPFACIGGAQHLAAAATAVAGAFYMMA